MTKYEIWGTDDAGKYVLLGYVTGEVPVVGDTMVVRGHLREVEKVWRHHVGHQATQRIKVGPPLEEEPPTS